MILCSNCQSREYEGALFCSNCGASLFQGLESDNQTAEIPVTESPPVRAITLQLVDQGVSIFVPYSAELTLGRSVEDQPFLPDVDFAKYEGYKSGVSRLHAILKIVDMELKIFDLGSSNGTKINGLKLKPNVDCQVKNDDVITLGRLKFKINF
jgi:pSer/pThr/pTyr-binding forkhead associated (FHA) protein